MPFSRPALADLKTRIRADLLSRMTADDVLRRADVEVYATVLAGAVHGLYGNLQYLTDQIFDDSAEDTYMERRAAVFGVSRLPAAAATGSVAFVLLQATAVVPAGTVLQALDTTQYQTTADSIASGLTATAPAAAVVAGAAGNQAPAAPLTLATAVAGVSSAVTVVELDGGADQETDDALRIRLLTRIQQPPQGGADYDYTAWALQVPGVTRAWVYPQEDGIGTVRVRFVRDNDGTGSAILPDSGEVAAVADYIDDRRPVTAEMFVSAPTASVLNFTISGLNPAEKTVKDAITASLADLLRREAQPNGTLLLTHIQEAISFSDGEIDHVLTSPTTNVVTTGGAMSIMGTVTFT